MNKVYTRTRIGDQFQKRQGTRHWGYVEGAANCLLEIQADGFLGRVVLGSGRRFAWTIRNLAEPVTGMPQPQVFIASTLSRPLPAIFSG
jgi:hypothetical protein